MQPLRDLLSSSMCPPTPKSSPMWMHKVLTYVPASQETLNTPKRFSGSNSKSSLSQMVLIRSSLLTAEISGGFWKRLPVRVFSTFFSLISESIGPCNRTIPIYYLPAVCCDLANLVALSRQTMRQPVTLGSRVPEWPVFSTLRILLTHETTSWELGLEGLSRLMTPYLRYSLRGRLRGVLPAGMGVQCVVSTFILWQFLSNSGHSYDRIRAPSSDGLITCSQLTIYSSTGAYFYANLFFFLSPPIVELIIKLQYNGTLRQRIAYPRKDEHYILEDYCWMDLDLFFFIRRKRSYSFSLFQMKKYNLLAFWV